MSGTGSAVRESLTDGQPSPTAGGCPRCRFPKPSPTECPRCGVVFAKLGRAAPAAAPVATAVEPSPTRRAFGWLDAVLLVSLVAATTLIVWRSMHPAPAETPLTTSPDTLGPTRAARSPGNAPEPVRVATSAPEAPAARAWPPGPVPWSGPSLGLPPTQTTPYAPRSAAPPVAPEDAAAFTAIARLVATRGEVDSSQIDQVESLHARYPAVPEVDQSVEDLLALAAHQASQRGLSVDAVRYLEDAAEQLPDRPRVWLRLIAVHQERRAWPDVERIARRALSALPDESALHLELAKALSQQGRDEEAADVLRRRLTARSDPAARALLAQLEASLASVAGLARRTSAHFSVTFEGQPDDALGQALVQTLEEKHAMLARTLDYEPTQAVPVILYPREVFKSTSSAPSWSGAYYSHGDGRIRIGTRDLGAGFVPLDLERTLTHELTHAFLHGLTRGAISRDVNEGLAQYLSGKRLGYKLDPARVAASNERVKVTDYYDSALSFVEYLIDHYRQPAMNDLLKYTGETGSVEQGFRRAYHQGYEEARQEWIKSLRTP